LLVEERPTVRRRFFHQQSGYLLGAEAGAQPLQIVRWPRQRTAPDSTWSPCSRPPRTTRSALIRRMAEGLLFRETESGSTFSWCPHLEGNAPV